MTTPRRLRLLSGSTELRRAAEYRTNQWAEAKGLGPMFRVRSRDGGWSWQARPKPLTAPMSSPSHCFNSERHGPLQHSIAGPFRHCACGLNCLETNPCLCCLAAEVERLKAQVQRVRDGVNVVLQRAQGVREFGGRSSDWIEAAESAAEVISDALDGTDV